MGAASGRLLSLLRQDHASNTAFDRAPFIARGAETAITCGEIRRAAKHGSMPIEGRPNQVWSWDTAQRLASQANEGRLTGDEVREQSTWHKMVDRSMFPRK
jgi:hypothetical protein